MIIKYLRLIHAFIEAFWILWVQFPHFSRERKLQEIQSWSQRTLDVLGIEVKRSASDHFGPENHSALLLVANHISWVDCLIIQTLQPSVFIAKAEVAHWPVIGSIAKGCGVIFVERSTPSSVRTMVNAASSALHQGYCVAGFPEGTSTEGHHVNTFHANLFEAAIAHHAQVMPIALRYSEANSGRLSTAAAFVGDIGFATSLHQIITAPRIQVTVQVGQPLSPIGHSRKSLAHLSHRSVMLQLANLGG
jgi:1-acyl-sn-glycerol-3-phosphate acyltransferase